MFVRFDETRQTISSAPVHAVQHQTGQMDVEVGGESEALDQRDATTMAFIVLEPSAQPADGA
ncbi:hypothetical protein [Pseudomonas fluorescens]